MGDDLAQPEHPDDDEPHDHHRAEDTRDPLRAAALDEEEGDQDRHGDRDHPRLEGGRGDLEALDRAEHRDRRRDQAVAVEQRRAEHAEGDDRPLRARRQAALRQQQRGQGEDAALAVVVGAHHEREVLDRDDHDERPEHDRCHAVGVGLRDLEVDVLERLPERVQRAGADVAEDDPQRAERQRGDSCVPSSGAFVGGHGGSS